ncbi:MAG: M81 family metallopeptidase, partial [Treponema sp.]|nr:M81 family metallopeptidase [Treponema sp.]
MRILTGGISHESNSFNPIITGENEFVIFRGAEITREGVLPRSSTAGIVKALKDAGAGIVPAIQARAVPNGVVSAAFYDKFKAEILERTREALKEGPIDGVCLGLHGSMKIEGCRCVEGDLASALRELLPDIPFTAALDMHATITPEFLKAVNGFVGYKTAPHVDPFETGIHAATVLLKALKAGKKLYTARQRIPMMVAGEKSETAMEPMMSLIEGCRKAEKNPAVLAASILLGFPWADNENNAAHVLVTSFEEDKAAADSAAKELAVQFWDRRKEFRFRTEHYPSKEAVAAAYQAVFEKGERPVFISDSGDNPTAGAAGDSTDLLEEIIKTQEEAGKLPTPLLYSGFYDAPAAAACIKAGEGSELDITLGGNWDKANGKKIPLRVRVKKIVLDYGPYHADLVLISSRNLLFTLTSKHIGFGDPELLPALGVDPRDYCLVAVKLGYLEPCFRTIAARAIMATSRGCSNEVLETLPYRMVKRPIYPLDPDTEWAPQ